MTFPLPHILNYTLIFSYVDQPRPSHGGLVLLPCRRASGRAGSTMLTAEPQGARVRHENAFQQRAFLPANAMWVCTCVLPRRRLRSISGASTVHNDTVTVHNQLLRINIPCSVEQCHTTDTPRPAQRYRKACCSTRRVVVRGCHDTIITTMCLVPCTLLLDFHLQVNFDTGAPCVQKEVQKERACTAHSFQINSFACMHSLLLLAMLRGGGTMRWLALVL